MHQLHQMVILLGFQNMNHFARRTPCRVGGWVWQAVVATVALIVFSVHAPVASAQDEAPTEKAPEKAPEKTQSKAANKPAKKTTDDLTAAALKRVSNQKAKALKAAKAAKAAKKVSKAAVAEKDSSNTESGPIIKSHPVSSHPAPMLSAEKCDPTSESGCVSKSEAKSEAKPETEPETKPETTTTTTTTEGSAKIESKHALSTVPAATSLKWLGNGNTRFVKRRFRADGRTEKDRLRLVSGESPHAIVLSCSDSRVPPELVFDQGLGEVHVIRVAGEVLDDSVIASVEAAIENFGAHLLVVMGHTQCETVQQALDLKPDSSGTVAGGSESLNKILQSVQSHLKTRATEKPSPGLQIEATLNADGVARELVTRSEIIRKHVENNDLIIKPALYRLETGKVTFY